MKACVYSFMMFLLASPISTVVAESTGAHHEPSIADLLYPTVNFVLLVAFLVWKLKKPMIDMFNKKSDDVKTLMNSAAVKNKDAEARLKMLQSKISNLDYEIIKIKADYDKDVDAFMANQANETQATIARTKKDLEQRLEGEKKDLVEKLNEELLTQVIAKTKQTINGNSDFKNRATSKIVSELR